MLERRNEISWPDNPVVEEVREIRRKLWQEGGGTLEGFVELVRKRAAARRKAARKRARKTPRPAPKKPKRK